MKTRRVTPGEVAHEIMERAPAYFMEPYLKSLGLKLTEDGELEKVGTGLKLHGFSRGGQVIRSRYPDYVEQQRTVERLMDRVYGKSRQALDVMATNRNVSVVIPMDPGRVQSVAAVLLGAGALGQGDAIDSTAIDMDDDDA